MNTTRPDPPAAHMVTIRESLNKQRDKLEDMIDTFRPYCHDNDLVRFRDRIAAVDAALAWLDQLTPPTVRNVLLAGLDELEYAEGKSRDIDEARAWLRAYPVPIATS